MTVFTYRNGVLSAEAVPLTAIAEAVGTPVYVYSSARLVANYRRFAAAFEGMNATVCYAVKANGNLAVLRTLAEEGAGADVVSEGELRLALAAGIPPQRIVFSGVGKTRAELGVALDRGIYQINVESEPELAALSAVAQARGRVAQIAIRVNPDVDARTHEKISTGRSEDKFGIDLDRAVAVYRQAAAMPGIEPVSIAVHIGSQMTDLGPFADAFARVAELVRTLRSEGVDIRRLDLGGGLGIVYRDEVPPDPADYARMVRETVGELGCELVFEPGRAIVGDAGVLLSRVIYVKEGRQRRFLIVDGAMNDLIRPSLYGAWHGIRAVTEPHDAGTMRECDIVGPVCETGDTFAKARPLPPLLAGELLVFDSAGAYGAVMASSYNARPLVPEVMVRDTEFAVVRARPSYEEMQAGERFAPWQSAPAAEAPRRRTSSP